MFTVKVDKEDFEKIKAGKKNYEIIISKDDVFVGDHILFKKKPELFDGILVKVTDKKMFTDFSEMATCMSLENLGFSGMTNTEVVDKCNKKYDAESVKENGITVCKFEL